MALTGQQSNDFRHRTPRGCGHQLPVFLDRYKTWDGAALGLPGGRSPKIGKITALLGFDRLHHTIFAREEHTFAIGLFLEGQSTAVGAQTRESLDEIKLAQVEKRGEAGDLLLGQPDLAGPATTGGAPLTFIKNWHAGKVATARLSAKPGPRAALKKTLASSSLRE